MIRCIKTAGALAAALACSLAGPAIADQPFLPGQHKLFSELTGYEETPAISSQGSGEFSARISQDGTQLTYTLTYRDLTAVTQSHIHFGRTATAGAVVLFLCTNGTAPMGVPPPQPCPANGGTITGTLTAADVIPVAAQGIDAGATGFADILAGIRNGSAYVNVHTSAHTGGEIRGQLLSRGSFRNRDDNDD